ncbi:MAG: protein translocase subunit SecD [Chloroflexi bacterium]|nr:protein translocase subunit SecD [Chloroflexota bacterium]
MQQKHIRLLIGIVILAIVAAWIDLPNNGGIHLDFAGIKIDREIKVHEGLDLQGGMQVMLEADVPPGQQIDSQAMLAAKGVVENRVNSLGVSEPLIQLQEKNRIIVELPGIKDPERAIQTFGQTGLLEFIDAGSIPPAEGSLVTTSMGGPNTVGKVALPTPTPEGGAAPSPTPSPTPSPSPTPETQNPITGTEQITPTTPGSAQASTPTGTKVYPTVMTGKHLKSADVSFDNLGRPQISFSLTDEGSKIFADYTSKNVGKYLAIVMDKKVISSPIIKGPITQGNGVIEGGDRGFPLEEARSVVIQLKYGSLPVPLKVVQNRTVGPTLGQDSINKSLIAGAIGLGVVVLFMLVYYRLPGVLANLALGIYALTVFALFKMIPVTLTLAGIAGFILSIGMAVDANILIFERTKEELRSGKTLGAAIEAGFARAWTSIRDSNISTLITCAILYWFGLNFGASIIKGFAFTLAIGVVVSMFTAITVTRTFLRVTQRVWFSDAHSMENPTVRWLFDIPGRKRGAESSLSGEEAVV